MFDDGLGGGIDSPLSLPPSSVPLVVFTVCLNPLFAFLHIRRLRFLFPPLSMHEVNGAGEHRRSIILLQEERSGRR